MNASQGQPVTATADAATSGAEPSAAFTPGRWRAAMDHNGRHEVRGPGLHTIAAVFHTPDGLGAANADLIAAAPDLLGSAKAWIDYLDAPDWLAENAHMTESRLLAAMRDAIAKALGADPKAGA